MVGDISDSKTLQTNRLMMVIINGNVGDAWPWAIHFTVKSADGPITGTFKFSLLVTVIL